MSQKRRWLALFACALAILGGWVVRDLSANSTHDLGEFDPHEVARLETAAWRAYYAHERLRLFTVMVELLRRQYRMPFWRSAAAAYYAAHAAVVFQPGHDRAEYERAMPDLVGLFALVHKGSETDFPIGSVARLELEWWIVHRERAQHPAGDLERALANVQAAVFQRPEALFEEHAKARADAMTMRDMRAEAGVVSEDDWRSIAQLLDHSWVSLRTAVARAGK